MLPGLSCDLASLLACETSPSLSCPLGFGLTAMLTVPYSNVQSVGAAISAMLGTDAFAKLPKEQNGCLHKQLQICI